MGLGMMRNVLATHMRHGSGCAVVRPMSVPRLT
jgi:hypothetical protein